MRAGGQAKDVWARLRAAFSGGDRRRREAAERAYASIVEAARAPALFRPPGLEDSADGRFESVFLHASIGFLRLRAAGEEALAQEATDWMFADFDRNLRELGVGDMSVGKRMHQLAQTYLARARDVEAAMALENEAARRAALAEVIARNAPLAPEAGPAASRLAQRLDEAAERLASAPREALARGELAFS